MWSLAVFMVVQPGCSCLTVHHLNFRGRDWILADGNCACDGTSSYFYVISVIQSQNTLDCTQIVQGCAGLSPRLWRKSLSWCVYVCTLAHLCTELFLSPGVPFSGKFSLHRFLRSLLVGFIEQLISWWSLPLQEPPSASLVQTEAPQAISLPHRVPFPTFSSEFLPLHGFSLWKVFLKCVVQGKI